MKHYTHDELLELLPAYALGALAADEVSAVDAALRAGTPQSETLRQELRAFEEVATQMASAHPVNPPAAAKERLFARVAADKQAMLPVRRTPAWLGAALAASIVAAAGFGLYSMSLRKALDRRETTLNAILEADRQLHVARVVPDDASSMAGIQLFWNEKQRRGVLHAFHMPQAKPGRAYQVWLLQNGKPVSIGVFNSDPDGHALVDRLTLPESTAGATLVLITDEPAGGSPGPTTQPFMRGEIGR